MIGNKDSYDWVVNNKFLSYEKSMEISKFIDENYEGYEPKEYGATNLDGSYKKTNTVKVINWKKLKPFLQDEVDELLQYIRFTLGLNVYDLHNNETLLYNIYSSDGEQKYDWHTDDSNAPLYDIKITAIINLSEKEYIGGDFQIFKTNEMTVHNLNQTGSVCLFRSYLNHRVLPVTKGERRSLAIFFKGPKYQ